MFRFFKKKKKTGQPIETLVVATHNKGKLEEFRILLGDRVQKLISAGELDLPEPEETGATFLENAKIKAVAGAKASGLPCLADDSGLCVDALGGNPGIYSARWGGADKDAMKSMNLVHERMGEAPATTDAHFMAVLVLAWPDGRIEEAEGRVDGDIVWPPRGSGGHGYDPIFMPKGEQKTFAEMSLDEKNRYSHRARAWQALSAKL